MARVYTSSIIDAPVAKVWERVRDFNALPRWQPGHRDSRIENGEPSDRIGCVRDFTCRMATASAKRLLGLSDYDYFCTYSILESPMPLTDYVATLRLTPVTDGDRTFAEWTAEFDCAAEVAEELVGNIGQNVFQAGFNAFEAADDAMSRGACDRAWQGEPLIGQGGQKQVIEAPVDTVWGVLRDFQRPRPLASDRGGKPCGARLGLRTRSAAYAISPRRRRTASRTAADAVGRRHGLLLLPARHAGAADQLRGACAACARYRRGPHLWHWEAASTRRRGGKRNCEHGGGERLPGRIRRHRAHLGVA